MELTNLDAADHYYETGQGNYFFLLAADSGEAVWTSSGCAAAMSIDEQPTGARPVSPGETVSVIESYPGPGDCFAPPGDYFLLGQFPICPDDAVVDNAIEGAFTCEAGRVETVVSDPLAITLSG